MIKDLEKFKIYCDEIAHEIILAMSKTRFKFLNVDVDSLTRDRTITYEDPQNKRKYNIVISAQEIGEQNE